MKPKIAAALVAIVAIGVGLAAFAQKQAGGGKVFLLKSGNKVIAELHVRPSADVEVQGVDSSGHSAYSTSTGTLVARSGVVLKVATGTNSITVRADEVESVPEAK